MIIVDWNTNRNMFDWIFKDYSNMMFMHIHVLIYLFNVVIYRIRPEPNIEN